MNRRSFGLLVRLAAVLAAIYALFILRSHLPEERQKGGPIPVTVVSGKPCGSIIVRPVTITDHTGPKPPTQENPALAKAMRTMGEPVTVQDQDECERLEKLHNSVFSIEGGSIRLEFKK